MRHWLNHCRKMRHPIFTAEAGNAIEGITSQAEVPKSPTARKRKHQLFR